MDHSLLAAFRERPEEATFIPLFEATRDIVYTVCRRVLRHQSDADDAFQETYSRLLQMVQGQSARGMSVLPESGDLCVVFGRLAYLEADRLRHKRARHSKREVLVDEYPETHGSDSDSIRDEIARREIRKKLEEAVAALPETYRVPLELHYFHGLSHGQIAEILGVPVNTIYSQMRRGVAQLEAPLQKAGVGGGAAALLGAAVAAGTQLMSPPQAFSASSVFAVARAASAVHGAAVAAKGVHTMLGAKLIAAVGGCMAVVCAVWVMQAGPGLFHTPPGSEKPQVSRVAGRQEAQSAVKPRHPALRTATSSSALNTKAVPATPAGTARISGRVFDASGTGMSSVTVVLASDESSASAPVRKQSTLTGSDGSYAFQNQPAGNILVGVQLPPTSSVYAPPPACHALLQHQDLRSVDFQLKEGLKISGTVDSDTSKSVSGAVIRVEYLTSGTKSVDNVSTSAHKCLCSTPGAWAGRFQQRTARSDDKGHFEVTGIDPEARSIGIRAQAEGCLPFAYAPLLPFSEPQRITLKTACEVLLVVSDGEADQPLKKFRYRFVSSWLRVEDQSYTDWSLPDASETPGQVRVKGVLPGEWRIQVEELNANDAANGRKAEATHTVTGQNDVVHFAVGVSRSIRGVVLDPQGKKLPGATVRVLPYNIPLSDLNESNLRSHHDMFGLKNEYTLGSTVSKADGSFELTGLAAGKYGLDAQLEDWLNKKPVWVEIPSQGEPQQAVIEMAMGALVYGKITGPDGAPMANAGVEQMGGAMVGQVVARSNAKGEYVVRHVRPNPYKLRLEGHTETTVDVNVKAGDDREVNFDLSQQVKLEGTVRVNGEAPQGEFRLFLRAKDKGYPMIWYDDVGFILQSSLNRPERYKVSVAPGEYYLWALYSDNRCLMVDQVVVEKTPRKQSRDFNIQTVDVSVVVLGPDSKAYDNGIVCFDQRVGMHVQPRVFSQSLKEKQSLFSDLVAGEYQVSFVASDSSLEGRSEWVQVAPGKENAVVVRARALNKGSKIGVWNSDSVSDYPKEHVYGAGQVVDGAGTYQVMPLYEWGACGMRIQSVALLENGREVARDTHEGWSGTGKRNHIYMLALPAYRAGAQYQVVVTMHGEGGTMSQGSVYMSKLGAEQAAR